MQSLLDEVIGMSLQHVTPSPTTGGSASASWRSATLDLFARYPAIGVEATVLTTHGPDELDVIEFMLDAFSRAGLEGDDLVRHYALLASHSLSSAAGIARSRSERGTTRGAEPVDRGSAARRPGAASAHRSLGPRLRALDDRDLFLLGVESVLDSAERTAAAAR